MTLSCAAIIEREFRAAAEVPAATCLRVVFDEAIFVTVGHRHIYIHEIGSDPRQFVFVSAHRTVRFDIPADYADTVAA